MELSGPPGDSEKAVSSATQAGYIQVFVALGGSAPGLCSDVAERDAKFEGRGSSANRRQVKIIAPGAFSAAMCRSMPSWAN